MRTFAASALVVLVVSASGCVAGSGPSRRPGADATLDAYRIPEAKKDEIRAKDKAETAKKEADDEEALEEREKAALEALRQVLGKASAHGGRAPESSTTVVTALRKTPIKVRIEPMTNDEGKAVSDDFVTLKDSYTDRVTALQQKIVEQTASRAEMKEIQDGSKYLLKVGDLRMQVMDISHTTYDANLHIQMDGLQTMMKNAMLLGHRRSMEMELDADDYAVIARSLERMRRAEALAAATMGMLAAYEAVINGGGDPKALDALASSTLSAFPLKPAVTEADAKQYVANMKGNIAAQKSKYEQMMRKTYGDAKYERKHKAEVDALFAQAESIQNMKSSREIMREKMGARGDETVPQDASAPAAASTPAAGGATPTPTAMGGGAAQRVAQGLGVADAARRGDATGALDGAAKMFAADGTIGSSLTGISALSKGDARGALTAAMNLVPGGGLLKDGLSLAANLLFGSSKKG